jgi:hypothetical protein
MDLARVGFANVKDRTPTTPAKGFIACIRRVAVRRAADGVREPKRV